MPSSEVAHPSASEHDVVSQAAELVAAYVSNNIVPIDAMPELIRSVHGSLKGLGQPAAAPAGEQGKPQPTVSIKKSITPDYLISLEDGQRYKSLKRHLKGRGLTPDEYRAKWGLPADYPMVAPNYSKHRSELARTLGLGQKRKDSGAAANAEEAPPRAARRKATAEAG